jgi:eukaryotic-like serine/threonine-protein kinase
VTAFDFGEADDGSWFLVMEMLEGETLGERLKRDKRLPWRDAARFVKHALLSLGEAHQKGIIHRDLKPDNLFLSRVRGSYVRELCKILDFGIAKRLEPDAEHIDALETQAGTVFGTPRYMSPEQAQGAQLDARSDLYSLGVLFYQMLSGRAPFFDDDAVVVMARHIKDEPPLFGVVAPDVEIPGSIERVLRRALAKSPAERPQSAEEFAAALDAAVEDAGSAASGVHTATVPEKAAPARKWRGALWSAFALGVVVVAAIAWAGVSIRGVARSGSAPEPIRPEPSPAAAAIQMPPTAATVSAPAAMREISTGESVTGASSAAASPSVSASAASKQRQRKPQSLSAPKLERKGNERYGRLE